MRVIITGGTGLIGHRLSYILLREGHEVVVLSRNSQAKRMPPNVQGARWDGYSAFGWGHLIDSNTVIVNLAGQNPANWRWTRKHKNRILHSRLDASEAVVEAIKNAKQKPLALIQASAVGYYGDCGDTEITEDSPAGHGFRADVCVDWEAATQAVPVRQVVLRIGIVLSTQGGFLQPIQVAARMMARRFGTGKQYIPWIHIDDVVYAISFLMNNKQMQGVYNLTAPLPVANDEFMETASEGLARPRLFNLPEWALKLLLGEQAEVVLDSQRVVPKRLLQAGYTFRYPRLQAAIDKLFEHQANRER